MSSVWDGSPHGAGHNLTGKARTAMFDGPISRDPPQKLKQHSTLLKVSLRYFDTVLVAYYLRNLFDV